MSDVSLDGSVRRLARGGSLSAFAMAVSAIVNFVQVIVVTRGLGRSGAGSFFQIMAFVNIVTTAASFGADTGFVRFIARIRSLRRPEDLAPTIRVGVLPPVVLSAIVAVSVAIAAPQLAPHVLDDPTARDVLHLRLLTPFIVIGTVAWVLTAATRGFSTLVPYNVIENFGKPIMRLALVWVATLVGASATAIALLWALPLLLALPVAVVSLRRLMGQERATTSTGAFAAVPSREIAHSFWRFSAPRGVGNIFQVGVTWLDVLLVGSILGAAPAATYTVVSRLVTTGMMLLDAIRLAVVAEISALLARDDRAATGRLYRLAASWCVSSSGPIYLLLFLFAPLALDVFGGQYGAGATALRILSLAMLVNVATGHAGALLLMGGRSGWMLVNNLIALSLDVALNVLLLPSHGLTGAAWAWAVSIVVTNVFNVVLIRRFFGIALVDRTYIRSVVVVVVFAVAAAGFVLLVGSTGPAAIAAVIVSVVVYLGMLASQRDQLGLSALFRSFGRGRAAPVVPA